MGPVAHPQISPSFPFSFQGERSWFFLSFSFIIYLFLNDEGPLAIPRFRDADNVVSLIKASLLNSSRGTFIVAPSVIPGSS